MSEREFVVGVTLPGTAEHFSRVCSGKVVVGRSPEADLQLVHPLVSRQHAELSLTEDRRFLVRDLGSRNGTVVNDDLLQDAASAFETAVVQIGPYLLNLAPGDTFEGDTLLASKGEKPVRVQLDKSLHTLRVDGRVVLERLSGLEYRLLELLADATPALVGNQQLGDAIWGVGAWDSYMLHNLVRRVRRKLEERGEDADQLILTVPGVGYRAS
jgi:FHA domain